MRSIVFPIFVFIIFSLFDWYFFQAIKTIIRDAPVNRQQQVKLIYWSTTIYSFTVFFLVMLIPALRNNRYFTTYFVSVAFILGVVKLLGSSFLLIEDITRFIRFIYEFISNKFSSQPSDESIRISRLKFFSYTSLAFAAIPFVSLVYGILKGGYRYKIHRSSISFKNLPESFRGLKIVHISDMHIGSFTNSAPLEKAFSLIMQEEADLIVFTGDLVNNKYTETDGFLETLKKLKAPIGVFSIFGNHDYGDYIPWDSIEEKEKAQESLKKVHGEAGWKLLWDEFTEIEKNGEKIALLGVQNWGARGFAKYGDLSKTHKGTEQYPFKILLSHDPSHWDKEVSKKYKDIDLTLSGHTHGFQFGIEIPGFKWSPSKYIYPHWAGLYQQGNQYLYVNRGLGFLGYPGRLGIWPEITVITLT
jgi:predicted MPP superfamily phosphohydrolase